MTPVLEVRDLHLYFDTFWGRIHALNGVGIALASGRITGLVGETGSGKSVLARSILRLLEQNAVVAAGQVLFQGEDLLSKTEAEMRRIRGKDLAMVFQDARSALNPVFPIRHQFERIVMFHQGVSRKEARDQVLSALHSVEITEPRRRARQYPHELSGGMCQRVMIAMALICSPKLIILDEPTTGLDVTVQGEILDLVRKLVDRSGTGALLITHDLGVVMETCDQVGVMYAGQLVEFGSTEAIFTNPHHPYTAALQAASLDVNRDAREPVAAIPGSVPDLRSLPQGCYFGARCSFRTEICETAPPVREVGPGHLARCFHAEQVAGRRDP